MGALCHAHLEMGCPRCEQLALAVAFRPHGLPPAKWAASGPGGGARGVVVPALQGYLWACPPTPACPGA